MQLDPKFFTHTTGTHFAWLGMATVLLNVRGRIIAIDPILSTHKKDGRIHSEAGPPLAIDLPILAEDIQKLDTVLYTHADEDHFAEPTVKTFHDLFNPQFISTPPVLESLTSFAIEQTQMREAKAHDTFIIGDDIEVTVTPALHDWQETDPWQYADCCGYKIKTPDITIWHPGDTRLIDELLEVKDVDVLLVDIADIDAHLGPDGSAAIAKTCGASLLIPIHYGLFDLPPGGFGTCDPVEAQKPFADNEAEYRILTPGETLNFA